MTGVRRGLSLLGMDTTAEVLRAAALDLTRTLHLDAVQLVPYDTANVLPVPPERCADLLARHKPRA